MISFQVWFYRISKGIYKLKEIIYVQRNNNTVFVVLRMSTSSRAFRIKWNNSLKKWRIKNTEEKLVNYHERLKD